MLLLSQTVRVVWVLLTVVGRALVSQAVLRHTPLVRLVWIAMSSAPSMSTAAIATVPSCLEVLPSVLVDVILHDTILVHGQSIALKALSFVPILVIIVIIWTKFFIVVFVTHHLIR